MKDQRPRPPILRSYRLPLVLPVLLATAWLASIGGLSYGTASETNQAGRLSAKQFYQQLGKPARFFLGTGDPDAPTSWWYASRDPDTWERVGVVATDREHIVAIRFDGGLDERERTTLPVLVFDITDRQVEILAKLPTLRSLTLIEAGTTAKHLQTLSSHPQLQVLVLEGCHISNDGLQWIGQMKALRSLTMHGVRIDPAGLKHLESLPSLARLELIGGVDDTMLASVSALRSLRFVHLGGTFTDEGLAHLAPLDFLEGLRVDFGNVEGTGLKHLRPDTLRELTLSRTMSDDGLIAAGRFTNLRKLNIGGSPVTDKGVNALRNMRKLERLSAGRTSITGAGLEHLTALRWAEFRNAGITSEGMKSFAGLVELEYLGLDGTRIDGDALKHLRGLRNLVKLDARRTKISNESLRHLDALQSLEQLDLSYCSELDDGAAPFLGRITSLKYLQVQGTQMTEATLPHLVDLRNLMGMDFPDNTGNVEDSNELKSVRRALPELGISLWPSRDR